MTRRQRLFLKYDGKCAYSGTPLESDWQIDHIRPILRVRGSALIPQDDVESNMVPCQRALNNYKGALSLEEFRSWYLGELHQRLLRLPKQPRTESSRKKKERLLRIAKYFDITTERPFSGKFYFEEIDEVGL